jgi:hypothetical protein
MTHDDVTTAEPEGPEPLHPASGDHKETNRSQELLQGTVFFFRQSVQQNLPLSCAQSPTSQ